MSIKFEKRPYEEEFKMVDAFFDKYQTLIDDAPQNSLLGMIRDLDGAMANIEGHVTDFDNGQSWYDANLKEAKEHITHVALILAQMWSDENQDIELVCTDPATGEEVEITGTPSEEES